MKVTRTKWSLHRGTSVATLFSFKTESRWALIGADRFMGHVGYSIHSLDAPHKSLVHNIRYTRKNRLITADGRRRCPHARFKMNKNPIY